MNDQATQTVILKKIKTTKNTIKFEETVTSGQPPIIGVLYVQKWWAGEADVVEVTITKR